MSYSFETLEPRRLLAADNAIHAEVNEVVYPSGFEKVGHAPVARFEAYHAVVEGKLYSMGGFNSEFEVVPNIDIFDPKAERWTTIKTDIPAAGTHAGYAVDGSSIYFAGGFLGDLGEGRTQPATRNVWRYDTATNNWESLTPLPAARGAGALVKVGRNIHYFGGTLSDRETNSGAHWMLNLGRSSGGADDATEWQRRPAMPSPRDHFSAVESHGEIFVFGGEYGHDVLHQQSKLVHSFNPETGIWRRLEDLPTAKSHTESATFAFGDSIIVAGGQVDDFQPTREVVAYHLPSNTWRTLPLLPESRQGTAVLPIEDLLVIAFGGVQTNQPQSDVWIASTNP